jgi:putative ABC transport system permease protein
MITVKIREGFDAETVEKNITSLYGKDGISVYTSDNLLGGLSDNLKDFASYSMLLNGLLLVSTAFALFSIFSITINERKREFGILRTLGAARTQLIMLIVGEAEIICSAGCLLGSLAAWFLTYTFRNYIISTLNVPFLQPQIQLIALIAGKCLLVSLVTGLIASLYAVAKISFAETYTLIRENEA